MAYYFFIINPRSGNGQTTAIYEKTISASCSRANIDYTIRHTQKPGHETTLAKEALNRKPDAVVAVGGDGTVNKVACALLESRCPLGIIPKGSGNGLATELGLSRDPQKACAQLFQAKILELDAGKINNQYFFNIAGIGLDAHVAHHFNDAARRRRGFWPYAKLTLQALMGFKPFSAEMTAQRQIISMDALLIAAAIGKQYGYGARIAPAAKINDGFFHVTAINPLSWLKALRYMPRLFNGTIQTCPEVLIWKTESLSVKTEKPVLYHVDGEPHPPAKMFHINIEPKALLILAPPEYNV